MPIVMIKFRTQYQKQKYNEQIILKFLTSKKSKYDLNITVTLYVYAVLDSLGVGMRYLF